jgi:hypothetical protein
MHHAYVNKNHVTGLAIFGDPSEGILDVFTGGGVGPAVVAQHQHLAFVEALGPYEVVLDVPELKGSRTTNRRYTC